MFTRIVECHVKPEKKDEFTRKLNQDVLPVLQKQPGFVDLIGLNDENESEHIVAISFWKSKEDADRYHREQYNRISDQLRPLVKQEPTVRTYTVNTSTSHKIAAVKAA